MTEKPRETQAESHVVELKEKVNNSSLMKHLRSAVIVIQTPCEDLAGTYGTFFWMFASVHLQTPPPRSLSGLPDLK